MRYLDDSLRNVGNSDLGFLSDAQVVRTLERAEWDAPEFAAPSETALGPWTRRVIVATAIWSACELPFEIWISRTPREMAACILGKLLWIALVCFALAGSRVARVAYGFLCTIGLMAVAFALPAEFRVFPLGFLLSSVECVLKATAFVCLVSAGVYPEEE
ncbi:hypothetical protein [Paraburkholderia sp. BCC1884]|uniref:hypothetical protein n=1 Tax=Paraburkholderia sp. BCC1884 TaxID=2562668 RepID=UPI0011821486|nr:hypothetical protein [Paraburkholderia sp. BCC1884]